MGFFSFFKPDALVLDAGVRVFGVLHSVTRARERVVHVAQEQQTPSDGAQNAAGAANPQPVAPGAANPQPVAPGAANNQLAVLGAANNQHAPAAAPRAPAAARRVVVDKSQVRFGGINGVGYIGAKARYGDVMEIGLQGQITPKGGPQLLIVADTKLGSFSLLPKSKHGAMTPTSYQEGNSKAFAKLESSHQFTTDLQHDLHLGCHAGVKHVFQSGTPKKEQRSSNSQPQRSIDAASVAVPLNPPATPVGQTGLSPFASKLSFAGAVALIVFSSALTTVRKTIKHAFLGEPELPSGWSVTTEDEMEVLRKNRKQAQSFSGKSQKQGKTSGQSGNSFLSIEEIEEDGDEFVDR